MSADGGARRSPDALRAEQLEIWQAASAGWGARAAAISAFGLPVAERMIGRLRPQAGQRLLELAAGPGDTGFLAAGLLGRSGTLLCSDAVEGMLAVARTRAAELGVENVEFAQLDLEWIDLPTAAVDAVVCRWGLMFAVDPEAALREARRVLRPGGSAAFAVWDDPAANPWATLPTRALVARGHAQPPDPMAPGMFALAAPGRITELLEGAGFLDVVVETVAVERRARDLQAFVDETLDLSSQFARLWRRLSERERAGVSEAIGRFAEPFRQADGSLVLPGRSLVASAGA